MYYKYPRTPHLPWSESTSNDDKVLKDISHFEGKEIVMTAKMDGENTSMYCDYIHARSITGRHHKSRNLIKNFHGRIKYNIPNGWRICGENMYAKHNIFYRNLIDYFLVFSVWDDKNMCLDYDKTIEFCKNLNLNGVPILYRGIWNEKLIKESYSELLDGDECEGYVIRLKDSFYYDDFKLSVAKFVSNKFKQNIGDNHWIYRDITQNILKK